MKNILIAVDDCDSTTVTSPIVERAVELAQAFSSRVWLLHVVPDTPEATPFNVDREILRREAAAELCDEHDFLQHLAKCLRERGVEAQALVVEGATTRTIVEESARLDIDLVILGCHRHSHLYGVFTEFTEEGVLSKCTRPILFVPVNG